MSCRTRRLSSRAPSSVVLVASVLAMSVFAAGCSSTAGVAVGIGAAKIYTEDDTLRFLAERRRGLDQLATTIQAAELQEIRSIREDLTVQVVAGIRTPGQTEPKQDSQLPGDTTAAKDKDIGLSYSELLQRQITRAQEFAAYDLLYLGDAEIQAQQHSIVLVRVDLSINSRIPCGSDPRFVVVRLVVKAHGRDTGKPRIYALMPEFSAVTSRESWLSSTLLDLAAAYSDAASKSTANARLQSRLEESFQFLLQQPLQYAIYDNDHASCAFALGPRRRLERQSRCWPWEWFRSRHRIEYEIQPGPRSCLAIVVLPQGAKEIEVDAEVAVESSAQPRGAGANGGATSTSGPGAAPDAENRQTAAADPQRGPADTKQESGNQAQDTQAQGSQCLQARLLSYDSLTTVGSEAWHQHHCTKVKLPVRASEPATRDHDLVPLQGGSLLVVSKEPIGSATRVFIGSHAIPLQNTHVLGARRLQVDVTKNQGLEAIRMAGRTGGQDPTIELRLVTPGQPIEIQRVRLIEDKTAAPAKTP